MTKPILFSLEHCMKCDQTKKILTNYDIEIITLPHDVTDWNDEQKQLVTKYNVLDHLQRTAPILWTPEETYVGYLKIKRWAEQS